MVTKIVLLNGVGSAGKSSIAKALQAITSEPFLHVQMDVFIEMLPESLQENSLGFSYETVLQNGNAAVAITVGTVGKQTLHGMRHAIAAMAGQGNNLIVDDVLCADSLLEYRSLLAGFEFHTVGVFAPLDVLEDRERQRGDRLIGLARWQYERIHKDIIYDLEIDTSATTPLECAERISKRFRLQDC